ncbi:DUF5994 family protein [Saccharopolyspora sp. NPDC049426]|uniref:DUF5994 family protein n=1 Tax=Saccharopolyspora sp. NPDC049426 TaxID=3155652 RepID=UPI003446953B
MGPDQRPGSAARLTLKPATGSRGFVDGAWWPRSTDPATEFTSLLTALTATSGPMTRLAYNLTAWNPAPRKLRVQGHQVRLEGFRTLDRRTVSLTDPSGHHLVLLLIPPTRPNPAGTRPWRGRPSATASPPPPSCWPMIRPRRKSRRKQFGRAKEATCSRADRLLST